MFRIVWDNTIDSLDYKTALGDLRFMEPEVPACYVRYVYGVEHKQPPLATASSLKVNNRCETHEVASLAGGRAVHGATALEDHGLQLTKKKSLMLAPKLCVFEFRACL